MALNGQAYAVDLDRIRAAFGSKDEDVLRSIAVLTDDAPDDEGASGVAEAVERLSGEDLSHDDPDIAEGREILLYQLKWALEREKAFVAVVNG